MGRASFPSDNAQTTLAAPFTAGSSTSFTLLANEDLFGIPSSTHPLRFTVTQADAFSATGLVTDVTKQATYRATARTGKVLSGLTWESGNQSQDFDIGDVIGAYVSKETIEQIDEDLATAEAAIVINAAGIASNAAAIALRALDTAVPHLTGNETIAGTKTFSSPIAGSITGNAATVTNGVVTSGSYADPAWITSLAGGKITGAGSIAQSIITNLVSDLALKAPLASPTFTGTVTGARIDLSDGSTPVAATGYSTAQVGIRTTFGARAYFSGGSQAECTLEARGNAADRKIFQFVTLNTGHTAFRGINDLFNAVTFTFLDLDHATGAHSFGGGSTYMAASSTTADQTQARVTPAWIVSTHASRLGKLTLTTSGFNGDHEGMHFEDTGNSGAGGAGICQPVIPIANVRDAADDTAAAALTPAVPVGGLYRTSSAVKIRVA